MQLRCLKDDKVYELKLEGIYDNLGLVVFHLEDAAGNVRVLELEVTEFRPVRA